MGVEDVPILGAVEDDRCAIDKFKGIAACGETAKCAVDDLIRIQKAVDGFGRTDAVLVITIGHTVHTAVEGRKLTTVLPREGGVVCPVQGIADFVVGDGGAIEISQAVCPDGVGVIVRYRVDGCIVEQVRFREDIAAGIVGVGDGVVGQSLRVGIRRPTSLYTREAIVLRHKLIQGIVLIRYPRAVGGRDFRDVACFVVFVGIRFALFQVPMSVSQLSVS